MIIGDMCICDISEDRKLLVRIIDIKDSSSSIGIHYICMIKGHKELRRNHRYATIRSFLTPISTLRRSIKWDLELYVYLRAKEARQDL